MDRPKPLTPDRRFSTWIAFLLGTAGVLVTVAGIYELLRDRPAAAAVEPVQAESPDARVARERALAEQQEVERQRRLIEIRRQRQEAAALHARGRCMDGVLIIKEGNEIRSAGRCQ